MTSLIQPHDEQDEHGEIVDVKVHIRAPAGKGFLCNECGLKVPELSALVLFKDKTTQGTCPDCARSKREKKFESRMADLRRILPRDVRLRVVRVDGVCPDHHRPMELVCSCGPNSFFQFNGYDHDDVGTAVGLLLLHRVETPHLDV